MPKHLVIRYRIYGVVETRTVEIVEPLDTYSTLWNYAELTLEQMYPEATIAGDVVILSVEWED